MIRDWDLFVSVMSNLSKKEKGVNTEFQRSLQHNDGEGIVRYDEKVESIMTCIIQLRISVQKSHHKGIFPYNPKPLLHRIYQVEALYDDPDV